MYKELDIYRKNKKFDNSLLKLLELFPDKGWNYLLLSGNPNIPVEYIRDNPEKQWEYSYYAYYNPNIDVEVEEKDTTIWTAYRSRLENVDPWRFSRVRETDNIRYYWLLRNPGCSWEKMLELRKSCPWDSVPSMSRNPNITWENIVNSGYENWDWEYIFFNKNITWENMVCMEREKGVYLNFNSISKHPNITWEIVKDNPEYPWAYDELSKNPNITWEIVRNNLGHNWSYRELCKNPNITWEIVRENFEYPWDIASLSGNPNITWEIIKDNPEYDWNPVYVSSNPSITWENVRDNSDYPWDWDELSRNPFLYNDVACYREYKKDVEKRRKKVYSILDRMLYKDLVGEILGYVGYD